MVSYEFVINELDENGDILNVNHADTIEEVMIARKLHLDAPSAEAATILIELVRDDQEGRSWAEIKIDPYVRIAKYFRDAHENVHATVPKRFHIQALNYDKKIKA